MHGTVAVSTSAARGSTRPVKCPQPTSPRAIRSGSPCPLHPPAGQCDKVGIRNAAAGGA